MILWQPLAHDPDLNEEILLALKGVKEPVLARFVGAGFVLLTHRYLGSMLLRHNADVLAWCPINMPKDYVQVRQK